MNNIEIAILEPMKVKPTMHVLLQEIPRVGEEIWIRDHKHNVEHKFIVDKILHEYTTWTARHLVIAYCHDRVS